MLRTCLHHSTIYCIQTGKKNLLLCFLNASLAEPIPDVEMLSSSLSSLSDPRDKCILGIEKDTLWSFLGNSLRYVYILCFTPKPLVWTHFILPKTFSKPFSWYFRNLHPCLLTSIHLTAFCWCIAVIRGTLPSQPVKLNSWKWTAIMCMSPACLCVSMWILVHTVCKQSKRYKENMDLLIITLPHRTAGGQELCVVPLTAHLVHYMTDRIVLGFCVTKHIIMPGCISAHLPKRNLGSPLMYYSTHVHYLGA